MIVSRCLETEHPEILREFIDNYAILTACPEAEHINMIGFKLLSILARSSYEELAVLTVDGSMHCIQLHYLLEELEKILSDKMPKRRHLVFERGKIIEISPDLVKVSRYLTKIFRLVEGQRRA